MEVSDHLFRLLADRTRDYAIFLLDPEGRVASWNTGAQLIKQYSADEIIGRHFSIFYTAPDIARQWPAYELDRAKREGRFEDEGWRLRKDGSRFWANVIITALRDSSGTLLAFSKITRDLSDRKQQEEHLRQSEERFRLLVEGVQDYAIYLLNPEGVITSWNAGARRMKGFEAVEVIGTHFSRFFTTEEVDAGTPWSGLAIARDAGRAEHEGWRMRKDGSKFWARGVITALYDSEGTLRGFAKVTQDLTQRRQSEALEASRKHLTDFIGILAHELRNPLAPIRNAVDMMKAVPADDPAQAHSRDVIDRQSRQLGRIVDDLLDVSRVTRGTLGIKAEPVAVEKVIERAIETVRPIIDARQHTLEVDLGGEPLLCRADLSRMTQALTNVLSNAATHSNPRGRIVVTVSRVHEEAGSKVQIAVKDTGFGIDPGMLNAIFGMFVQGRSAAYRSPAGLGVGLALARSIVELHHGTLVARSEGIGRGAEFQIRLPEVSQKETSAASDGVRDGVHRRPRKVRILVVDDNVDAATALASLLERQGHDVTTVFDGSQALGIAEHLRPEIILLDIGMPGMSGLEVARRLRDRDRTPRPLLVAVTGWDQADDRHATADAGFDRHLLKPVDEAELLRLIEAERQA